MRYLVLLAGCTVTATLVGEEIPPPDSDTDVDTDLDVDVDVDVDVDADTDADTDTDPTGLVGVVGVHGWVEYVGTYWGAPAEAYGYDWAVFTEPSEEWVYWRQWAPGLDQCASDYPGEWTLDIRTPTVGQVLLEGPRHTLELEKDPDAEYYYLSQWDAQDLYQAGSRFTMTSESSSGWDAFEWPDVLRTPEPFEVVEPAIHGDVVVSTPAAVHLEWTGEGGDFMLGIFYRYDGDELAETVTCAMEDDGAFDVPEDVWASWTGDYLIFGVIRAIGGDGARSSDGAASAMVGTYWVIGAAYLADPEE